MPTGSWNLEWLNHNAQRKYPLADDSTGLDTTGSFGIPTNFIVELDLPVHAGLNVGPAGFFVYNLSSYAGGYGITIGYQPADGSTPVAVATALIPRTSVTRNSVFTLGGIGDFVDTVGKIVIGRLDGIDAQPAGFWEFSMEAARIDADAIRPILRGVSSITCVSGGQSSPKLYGDIELVAGSNMQIVPILQEGQDPIIVLNAISGEGTKQECVCEGDSALSQPITSINGVAPTPSGNLVLVGNDCLQISTITNGIQISDVCAQPCCGCAELERITSDLQRFGEQVGSVKAFIATLGNAVDTMGLTVLGARLGDRGCITCQ